MNVSDSDSDTPIPIDPPLQSGARPRGRRTRTNASADADMLSSVSSSGSVVEVGRVPSPVIAAAPVPAPELVHSNVLPTPASEPVSQPTPPRRRGRPPKNRARTPEDEDEDDGVVFLRETVVAGLAARFKYDIPAAAGSSSSATPPAAAAATPTPEVKSSNRHTSIAPKRRGRPPRAASTTPSVPSTRGTTPLPLYTPPASLPIPDWLGRPAILLQVTACVVCHQQFAKKHSGPDRWVSYSLST
jgi:hypothetical protein